MWFKSAARRRWLGGHALERSLAFNYYIDNFCVDRRWILALCRGATPSTISSFSCRSMKK